MSSSPASSTGPSREKNRNPCLPCKKLKHRCEGVYPNPCPYCLQTNKKCKYSKTGDIFVQCNPSNASRGQHGDGRIGNGPQFDQLLPMSPQPSTPVAADPRAGQTINVNVVVARGTESTDLVLGSSHLHANHFSAPMGVDSRHTAVQFATSSPYIPPNVYGDTQMSSPFMMSDYETYQASSMGETTPDCDALEPGASYNGYTNVPPNSSTGGVASAAILDEQASDFKALEQRRARNDAREANDSHMMAAQAGLEAFTEQQKKWQ